VVIDASKVPKESIFRNPEYEGYGLLREVSYHHEDYTVQKTMEETGGRNR
jgi:hypothetical protein